MAIPGDETPGAVDSNGAGGLGEEVAHSGGAGGLEEEVATSKDDQEDVEMSDGLGRNITNSKDTEDSDMDGNRAEIDGHNPSQNLLEQDETLQPDNDANEHQDDENYGEVNECPESQDEDEDIVGLEGNVQDNNDSDVLKDSTNTGEEEVAEKLFRFPQGTIKRVMKLDPEVSPF